MLAVNPAGMNRILILVEENIIKFFFCLLVQTSGLVIYNCLIQGSIVVVFVQTKDYSRQLRQWVAAMLLHICEYTVECGCCLLTRHSCIGHKEKNKICNRCAINMSFMFHEPCFVWNEAKTCHVK